MVQMIYRLRSVLSARGVGRSTHYNDIRDGLFTKPVPIGERAVGWPEDEVAAINAARISGKTADEIRALVIKLEAKRADAQGVPA